MVIICDVGIDSVDVVLVVGVSVVSSGGVCVKWLVSW